MGREASHLTLEVALLTQPNLAFIGEEVRASALTLSVHGFDVPAAVGQPATA